MGRLGYDRPEPAEGPCACSPSAQDIPATHTVKRIIPVIME
jgi:hypothetical protein